MTSQNILVTNYEKGIHSQPIKDVMINERISFDLASMELSINESLFVGVFDSLPQMRRIKDNESWFKKNIYHLR